MKISVLGEHGYLMALFGLGFSYGHTSGLTFDEFSANKELVARMHKVATTLKDKQGGENKFLRQIQVIVDLEMPLYWWKECDTYKVGTCAQSESTMHTIMRKPFELSMFSDSFTKYEKGAQIMLNELNFLRSAYGMTDIPEQKKEIWNSIIALLPNAWLQRRILSLNYAVLQNMLTMRKNHKLAEWREFCRTIYTSVEHPEFLPDPTC
ncbi:MAG: hypothetical protein IKO41_14210 [Lachnospiraceae bacterium]|nr:hypothetical protein [Lachnospiraceae bacterium]